MDKYFKKIENFLLNVIKSQTSDKTHQEKKRNGIFYTTAFDIIEEILSVIPLSNEILNKKILEPSCGNGIFLLTILYKIFKKFQDKQIITDFIANNLIFCDIDRNSVNLTKANINAFYNLLFNEDYSKNYNGFVYDFTKNVTENKNFLFETDKNNPLFKYLEKIDFVIGNPPYVSLYGRRGKKKSEENRLYYLKHYKQFPSTLKNGRINYIMLFIENALELLAPNGKISFIIDISFFETPFLYTRKFLLENTKILKLIYNINEFNVGSGQLILEVEKNKDNTNNKVILIDYSNKSINRILQKYWNNPLNEYKFTLSLSETTKKILQKISDKNPLPLTSLYPHKNLRTCVMPLNMEKKFIYKTPSNLKQEYVFRYYKGSQGLKEKYGMFHFDSYFYFDTKLQKKINDNLKFLLKEQGIKNKKRIGLGEIIIYNNPKLFIRQSAKQIIASYDEEKSAANNSLYVFSLRDNSEFTKNELFYICGILNSMLTTFFCQKKQIIRYTKGKQPQIKISDLYKVPIPQDANLKRNIIKIVKHYYLNKIDYKELIQKVDTAIFDYYNITNKEIKYIQNEINKF